MFDKTITILNILVFIAVIFIGFSFLLPEVLNLFPDLSDLFSYGEGECEIDNDCVVFGETGECNCGCYSKNNLPTSTEGDCFCLAPTSCECVDGKCKNVYVEVNNFQDCVEAGFPILETYPRRCQTNNNTYIEEFCTDQETGKILTLETAKKIAIEGECGDNLGEVFICNKVTGTYWIDLNLKKENCNPACVVGIEDREATINWRCTGLID